jgi:hypothetical protein
MQCNTGLPAGAKNCYKCGAIVGSAEPANPGSIQETSAEAPAPAPKSADLFSEISGALHRAEHEIPWNGIFLGMAFLFLLITYFNK